MNITTANLGWLLLACLLAGIVLASIQERLAVQYEVTRHGRWFRVNRRWYGTRAHVCLRGAEDDDDPDLYVVLDRDDENTAVPWLKACKLDPDHITRWAEDAEPLWAPVTEFAPYSVRMFRPGVIRFFRVPVPWFSWYLPLRRPSGYLRDGA